MKRLVWHLSYKYASDENIQRLPLSRHAVAAPAKPQIGFEAQPPQRRPERTASTMEDLRFVRGPFATKHCEAGTVSAYFFAARGTFQSCRYSRWEKGRRIPPTRNTTIDDEAVAPKHGGSSGAHGLEEERTRNFPKCLAGAYLAQSGAQAGLAPSTHNILNLLDFHWSGRGESNARP